MILKVVAYFFFSTQETVILYVSELYLRLWYAFANFDKNRFAIVFIDNPPIKLFKLLNMPGLALENDYYSTSKQNEIKKKVIRTCQIFPKIYAPTSGLELLARF
mgnify:CR=1 FL=1